MQFGWVLIWIGALLVAAGLLKGRLRPKTVYKVLPRPFDDMWKENDFAISDNLNFFELDDSHIDNRRQLFVEFSGGVL